MTTMVGACEYAPYALVAVALLLAAAAASNAAEPWKPAAGPLLTRWGKEVSPQNVHGEYPRPQLIRRQWMNLNGLWDMDAAEPDASGPPARSLSHQILVPFPLESALSGVMRHADRVWYRRAFEVPADWSGSRVLLHLQAVDWEAAVFVNGREVGSHRGGYDPFSFDITEFLRPSGKQELAVRVFDPTDQSGQPRGKQVLKPKGTRYTPSTGIWQTVWLEPVSPVYIGRLMLTPDVDRSTLRLVVEGMGTGAAHQVVAVASDGRQEIARAAGSVGTELRLAIPAEKLKLWSPDSPFLYDLAVTLRCEKETFDVVQSYFGMRKIDLAKDEQGVVRMRLNNQFLFQVGPLDQGFWPDGLYTAPSDEAMRYDLEMVKRLGFNMVRKHVKVEPSRWYYWCDRLGILVWQDMPSGGNPSPPWHQQFAAELSRMVLGLRNHPSVVMWVVFNEGWGQHDTERYVDLVRQLDQTRLINNASGWTDKRVGDIVDVHHYPNPIAPDPDPNRAGVLGEFGGLGLGVPGHTWSQKSWGYRGAANSEELTRRYQSLLQEAWGLRQSRGLSAAVYTQLADTETECNGLLTYDRAVVKVDLEKAAAANQGRFAEPSPPTYPPPR